MRLVATILDPIVLDCPHHSSPSNKTVLCLQGLVPMSLTFLVFMLRNRRLLSTPIGLYTYFQYLSI